MYSSNILWFKNSFVYVLIALNMRLFSASGNFKGLRVFQGRDVKRGEFPYAVALYKKSWYTKSTSSESTSESLSFFCSGSIITPVWVLTAGHCLVRVQNLIDPQSDPSPNTKKQKVVIQYVSPKDNNSWSTSNVIRTILHPNFKLTELIVVHDIALAKVQNTTVSVFGTLSSVPFGTMFGHKVFSLGFGSMKSESGQINLSMILNKPPQVYDAMVIKCGRNSKVLISTSFCLAWNCHKPATNCNGDSGGPIIHPSGIIGVTTGGNNTYCNTTETSVIAGIVTPVSPYVDWIARSIREI